MPTYPKIPAGARLSSGLLTSMLPTELWKAASTDRTSTTTFADDPDLTTPLAANAVYRVRFVLLYAALDAVRFKTMWTVPANASGNRTAVGPDQGAVLSVTSGGQGRWGVHNFNTSCTYGTRDHITNLCAAIEEATIFTLDAGTLALQWAQATSSASPTRLGIGSSLTVKRVA
ncbi:hypothetical protein ACFYRN_10025 [Streptomyces sp. NPDC005227]|uniref:hypothetical protein n=1 Tax=Streptomyces sp. NPDC005227 TaxID=3364707 RepID=UPI003689128E